MLIMSIYTRTGDDGTTGLFGGKRVPKNDKRIELIGLIDELNAWIGMITISVHDNTIEQFLTSIQNDLFTMGSFLAESGADITELLPKVVQIEHAIDQLEKQLPELHDFILPGGSNSSSIIHVARTVCRRVERGLCRVERSALNYPEIIKYLNRLSDYLFVLARYVNKRDGLIDVLWKKK